MILTLTGFEGRDRDWVKDMIRMSGAKYTSYFSKHNHAIVCRTTASAQDTSGKKIITVFTIVFILYNCLGSGILAYSIKKKMCSTLFCSTMVSEGDMINFLIDPMSN